MTTKKKYNMMKVSALLVTVVNGCTARPIGLELTSPNCPRALLHAVAEEGAKSIALFLLAARTRRRQGAMRATLFAPPYPAEVGNMQDHKVLLCINKIIRMIQGSRTPRKLPPRQRCYEERLVELCLCSFQIIIHISRAAVGGDIRI